MSPVISRGFLVLRKAAAVFLLTVTAIGYASTGETTEFDRDRLRTTPPPPETNLAEEVIRADQKARDDKRQGRVDELRRLLARDRQEWQELRGQLDRELDAAILQANRQAAVDAALGAWSTFFRLVSTAAFAAQKYAQKPAGAGESTSAAGNGPDGTQVGERYQLEVKEVEIWKDGVRWEIKSEKLLHEVFGPESGAKNPAIRQRVLELRQIASRLPQLPPIRICDSVVPGCIAVPGAALPPSSFQESPHPSPVEQPAVPEIFATLPFNALDVPGAPSGPSGGQRLLSALVDLAPFAGTAKGFAEFASGKDPFTDEEVSRPLAAVGIMAGTLPGGKLVIRVVKGSPKKAIIKGVRALRHYTSRGGSKGMAEDGVIRAGEDGLVYAVRASKPVWDPATARNKLRLSGDKGIDYVELELSPNKPFTTRIHKVTGEEEIVILGDIRLDPDRSVIIQR